MTIDLPGDVDWSVDVRLSTLAEPLILATPHRVCATASVGKVLLLIAIAEGLETGRLAPEAALSRDDVQSVADSGLWQHLEAARVSISDLCVLVGTTSDNWATNALIGRIGLDAIAQTGRRLGMEQTRLLDIVRDDRTPDDPVALSVGSAAELRHLCESLQHANGLSPGVAGQVRSWLALNTDLSMVASAFGLDPLAHGGEDRGFVLWNKTGTNRGVRGDIGVVVAGERVVSYAVLASWTPTGRSDPLRDEVLAAMRTIGELIRRALVEHS